MIQLKIIGNNLTNDTWKVGTVKLKNDVVLPAITMKSGKKELYIPMTQEANEMLLEDGGMPPSEENYCRLDKNIAVRFNQNHRAKIDIINDGSLSDNVVLFDMWFEEGEFIVRMKNSDSTIFLASGYENNYKIAAIFKDNTVLSFYTSKGKEITASLDEEGKVIIEQDQYDSIEADPTPLIIIPTMLLGRETKPRSLYVYTDKKYEEVVKKMSIEKHAQLAYLSETSKRDFIQEFSRRNVSKTILLYKPSNHLKTALLKMQLDVKVI